MSCLGVELVGERVDLGLLIFDDLLDCSGPETMAGCSRYRSRIAAVRELLDQRRGRGVSPGGISPADTSVF
jgi:hypothetical protein